jgi:transposase
MPKRERHSAEFKAKVALEAIREELTTAELAKKHGVHPTMISGWKKTAISNMASAFGGRAEEEPPISQKDVEKLHARLLSRRRISSLTSFRSFVLGVPVLGDVPPDRRL